MTKDNFKTSVTFYIESKMYEELPPEVFAVFFNEKDGRFVQSYAHLGQHSECAMSYIEQKCRLATEQEYDDLKQELEGHVGYDLAIFQSYLVGIY